MTLVLVLPSPPALLPPYSADDPVADLRAACANAAKELPERVTVVAPVLRDVDRARGIGVPLGFRVARHLLGRHQLEELVAGPGLGERLREERPAALAVMADGSARRHEKAPGHLHPDAVAFDDQVAKALAAGDAESLAGLDGTLAEEVWCSGAPAFRVLGELAADRSVAAELLHAEAPYGVAWWVARWTIAWADGAA